VEHFITVEHLICHKSTKKRAATHQKGKKIHGNSRNFPGIPREFHGKIMEKATKAIGSAAGTLELAAMAFGGIKAECARAMEGSDPLVHADRAHTLAAIGEALADRAAGY
jgi:hypothetical protein